ncbi:hypothetical protein POX_g09362 [Penicillium oxalicum]|uniref:hypothetical protein n=1 Tax=Penicillium oxalicum TaxID=69781 RepID=UPI0020B80DE6|nr:hypothetical protein POX_g09362 [Penicillium oxalicum]KAI2786965.1 hypothetical protein POX_g09362 [Penicillium oxalicum]
MDSPPTISPSSTSLSHNPIGEATEMPTPTLTFKVVESQLHEDILAKRTAWRFFADGPEEVFNQLQVDKSPIT